MDAAAKRTTGKLVKLARRGHRADQLRQEPPPRSTHPHARQRPLQREKEDHRAQGRQADAALLQRRPGQEVHADLSGGRGVQGADRRRQDHQHPRPLLPDQAHPRGHPAEHLRGAGRERPDHRGPRGDRRRAARGAAPLRLEQGQPGRRDHAGRFRRHHRRPAHGLRRLGGALNRRGRHHPVQEVRGQVHPAGREGRRLPSAQRGPLLEEAPLHLDPRRGPASPRRAPAACTGCTAS